MNSDHRRRQWLITAFLSLSIAALGLSAFSPRGIGAQGTGNTASCGVALTVGQETDACLRFVHASADAGSVDIYVDGKPIALNVDVGSVTGFSALTGGGEHQIQVAPSGQRPVKPMLDEQPTFDAGQAYEVAVIGAVDNGLRLQADPIDLSATPAGQARVRVIHAIAGAGEATVSPADGTTLFEGVAFGEASDYATVEAGTVDLHVAFGQGGATPVASAATPAAVDARGVELKDGTVYDVYVIGDPASARLLVVEAPAAAGVTGTPGAAASPVS